MNTEHLVEMANRIGEFFQSMPDAEEGRTEIALHLRKFWEPRMRRQLLAHVDSTAQASAADGLLPLVRLAVVSHRAELV